MLKKTTLQIPNDIDYLDMTFAYIEEITTVLDYSSKEKYLMKLAVEESISNIIKHAFEEGEEEVIHVSCEVISNALKISIKDNGMPFDPSLVQEYDPNSTEIEDDSLSTFLMKISMDEVNYLNLGKGGNEIQLIKYLPSKIITQYEELKREQESQSKEEAITTEVVKEIRPIKPEEAIEVAKCVYVSYGNTYVNEDLYYPERIKELNRSGQMTSVIARSESGITAGHVAIFKPSAEANITEWGVAVVNHLFRGQGVMNNMVTYILNLAQQQGYDGVFAHCVTEHEYTQKICHKYGFGDIAVTLGYSPATVKYKKMAENLSQRQTIIFCFKYYEVPENIRLFLPPKHKLMLEEIYSGINSKVEDLADSIGNIEMEGTSQITSELKAARSVGTITVNSYGKDFNKIIKSELKRLCVEGMDVIYAYLNLEDPLTSVMCDELEECGFFFSGILPGYPFNHTLILQYMNNIKIDFSKIVARSELAKKMMEYIKSNVFNN